MTKRENLLRALRRDNPEYVPFDMDLCPAQMKQLKERTGTDDFHAYFDMAYRFVELNPTRLQRDFSRYYQGVEGKLEPLSWNPEWGVMGIGGSTAHFQQMLHPMQKFTTVEEIMEYPFPDFDADYRWEGVAERNLELIENGYATLAFMEMTIFEVAWYLRGMEELMVGFYDDPEFNAALLDKLTDLRVEMAKRYARAHTDVLMLGDDVSTQISMMMSPSLWREELKPRLKRVIDAAKAEKSDILIFYHGDGNLSAIVEDLIEIGVDVLNPVQPECVNPFELKHRYGDRLSFWGCVGTQTTMPFGTRDEIFEVCKKLIREVGKGGGLVLAPTHTLEPEVPFENIQAFLDAVEQFGKYKGGK